MNWNEHRISSIVLRFELFSFDRNTIIQNLTNTEQKI